ncbi:MAG: hypothetical protein VCC99_05470, partial [Alphaproteobacteria bacterium]
EQGLTQAAFRLSRMYRTGDGVPRNFRASREWTVRAAVGGHAAAQYHLAALYFRGEGQQADPVRALIWYHHADRGGYVGAAQMRDAIVKSLTPQQRAEIDDIAIKIERALTRAAVAE